MKVVIGVQSTETVTGTMLDFPLCLWARSITGDQDVMLNGGSYVPIMHMNNIGVRKTSDPIASLTTEQERDNDDRDS